jgi:hypothetical protein
MQSYPLEVHQVLEEEYVAMHGPLDRPGALYDAAQILNVTEARRILHACGVSIASVDDIAATLNKFLTAKEAPKVGDSPVLTSRGRKLIDDYDDFREAARKQDDVNGAIELNRTIVDDAFTGSVKRLRDIRLDNVYEHLHARARAKQPRTALCVSGGGIRSATFALGIIQGLASADLLKRFDYLSTVSGGGYIGSWLSSWVRRHPKGVAGVENDLHRTDTAIASLANEQDGTTKNREIPDSNIDPEAAPVRHLREYSNYMSPRLGLLSGDSWTIASHYLRNLLLNLLVLVPLLAMALAIPRFFSWGLMQNQRWDGTVLPWLFAAFTTMSFAYIGAARPLERGSARKAAKKISSNTGYFLGVVVPLVAASCALALFWARVTIDKSLLTQPNTVNAAIAAAIGMVVVPWAIYYGRIYFMAAALRETDLNEANSQGKYVGQKTLFELFAVTIALATSAALFYLLAVKVFDEPLRFTPKLPLLSPHARIGVPSSPQSQLYVCFAIPAAVLVFFVQATIFVGLSSRRNEDSDREWWGRGGAMLLMVAVGLSLFSYIAVFGPVALYAAPAILGSIGGVAGIGAAVLGSSSKTPANQKQKEESGMAATIGNAASALLVPFFVVFILAAISLGSTWLLQRFGPDLISDSTYMAKRAALVSQYSEKRTDVAPNDESKSIVTNEEMAPAALANLADVRAYEHLDGVQNTSGYQLLGFLGVGIAAVLLSRSISVNKFSMHALYRNRLIRAYLGASRTRRQPDTFTGFDENDNVQMWELRPELLWKTQVREGFTAAIVKGETKLAAFVRDQLDGKTRSALTKNPNDDAAIDELMQQLNVLMMTVDFAEKTGVENWLESDRKTHIGYGLSFRNRKLLDKTFDKLIEPMPETPEQRGPVHVVNTALNLTTGENIGWQQRMAESFTVSPFHTGSLYVGYRSSHEYGGPRGISLGTAVTISGAAASPNMGYHSSPAMAFLLTMFNVRLGAWLGNPGVHGQDAYDAGHPSSNLQPLLSELTGGSNDRDDWVYLSDGGHFENLGIYEMILRRCHYIVASDAGADPKFSFEDLGNAIRKIRTDLGVPIDLVGGINMQPRDDAGKFGKGRFVARAKIRYSVVDKDGEDGTLIYIKAGIYENDTSLPRDVYNYSQESLLFPHEPTSDQFFSESQFESYRALGRHAINDICANYTCDPALTSARLPIAKRFTSLHAFDRAVQANTEPRV